MATVKFKDTTLTLLGNEVKVGDRAPDFKVQKSADMSDYVGERCRQNAYYCDRAFFGHAGMRPGSEKV